MAQTRQKNCTAWWILGRIRRRACTT